MRLRRILTFVLVALAAVVLLDSGVRLYGYVNTVSGGLTIHTEAAQDSYDAPANVRFDYDVLGPLLCATRCESMIIRHDTGETIARENRTGSISADIASESSLKEVPVQLAVECSTPETRYCAHTTQSASDVATVRFSLDEDDARRRASLIEHKERIEAEMARSLSILDALATLEAPYEEIARAAEEEKPRYTKHVFDYLDAIRAERYDAQVPRAPEAVLVWEEERDASEVVPNVSADVSERLSLLSRYTSLLGTDEEGFDLLTTRYTELRGPPTTILGSLEDINEQLDRLISRRSEQIIEGAYRAAQDTHLARTAACRIYRTPCPSPPAMPATLADAERLSRSACEATQTSVETLKTRYAASLNLTLEDAEEAYNVSALENSSSFAAFEAEAIMNATRAEVMLTPGERLAITVPIEANFCERAPYEPLTIETPELELDEYDVTITVRDAHGCLFGSCDVEPKTPILFIHGHSFSEGSDPTANMQTMTDLAYAFEEHGYLYAGHLFPSSERDLEHIEVPVSFTATYYLNSYVEEGTIRLQPFKSEPIESYAIRLREDIEEARELTGSERVVLVAHSMGGLVARSYLDLFGDDRVERLIMIGTPNHGVTARTERLCPILGAGLECRDMTKGSVFLRKLNDAERPSIPMHVIAGTGCDEGDGIVDLENALLVGAGTTIINGSCSGLSTLHADLIDPDRTPATVSTIAGLLG